MKKVLIALLVAAAPVAASAQVELISGFNFGQFIFAEEATTDGANGVVVQSIHSNYAGTTVPGVEDSGYYKLQNGIETPFSAGVATIYWNGTNGSDSWTYSTGVSVYEHGSLDAANGALVSGDTMYYGDDTNFGLNFNSANGNDSFALVIDTSGFADFSPTGTDNDFNFTLAAFAKTGATASVQWFFDGISIGTMTAASGAHQAFNLDLPTSFYGNANTTLVGVVTGDLVIDNVQLNGVASAIPEPSAFAAVAGALGLGFAASRRRRIA